METMFSFLLQTSTPDTTNYMYLGYTVIFGVIALYLVSLIVRFRNLRQDLVMMKDLEEKS